MEAAIRYSNVTSRLVKEFQDNPTSYDKLDVDNVLVNGWLLKNAVFECIMTEDEVFENITTTLKWRKSTNLNSFDDEYFPKEFYEMGIVFPCNKDKINNSLLFLRLSAFNKLRPLKKLLKQFTFHQMTKMDYAEKGANWDLVIDYTDSGLINFEIDFILRKIDKHFNSIRYIIHLNTNVLERSLVTLKSRKMNISIKHKFCSSLYLSRYIDEEQVPKVCGGGFDNKMDVPDETKAFMEVYERYGLTKKYAENGVKELQKFMIKN